MRIGGALLAATLTATSVFVFAIALRFGATDLADAMSFAVAVVMVAGFPSLLIGFPAHLLFLFAGWNQFWKYAVGGACIGLLGGHFLGSMSKEDVVSGAAGAAVFWAIAGSGPTVDTS